MSSKDKAIQHLCQAGINLAGAGEVLREKQLQELSGEITAINMIIGYIREETQNSVY